MTALERIADVVAMAIDVGGIFEAASLAYSGFPAVLGAQANAELSKREQPLSTDEFLDVASEHLGTALMVEVAAAAALVRLLAEELARRDGVNVVAVLRECMDAARAEVTNG